MSTRFGQSSADSIQTAVEQTTPINTKKSKNTIWKQFSEFCLERNYELTASTELKQIATILEDWAYNMRKKNGENYKESVVKTLWNGTAKLIQEKYFKDYNRKMDPFTDIEFKTARDARNCKRRELQFILEKRKSSAAALKKEEIEQMIAAWDENTPNGLQRKFYHTASYELAWRGGEASKALVQYFREEIDHYGNQSGRIEYNPIISKTAQGGSRRLTDSKFLTPNKNNTDKCPVRLFHKLMSKRTENIQIDRFFLSPNPYWQEPLSKGWYKNLPVGQNEIGKWTKQAAQKIGLDPKKIKITNHSHRSSAVTQLAKSGVGEQQLLKITGHSSANSIKPYLQLDEKHHATVINKLRGDTVSSSSSQGNSTITYNNCTINYNNCKDS